MKKKLFISGLLMLMVFGSNLFAQEKTIVNSQTAKQKLLGKHMLSLQWISWDHFGTALVSQQKGIFYLKGEQKGKKDNDYLKIDGVITEINSTNFRFDGKITIRVKYNNGGKPCIREGEMTFAIRENRKYWRLQEMNNPCEDILDYVDIYFRR